MGEYPFLRVALCYKTPFLIGIPAFKKVHALSTLVNPTLKIENGVYNEG